jgi:tetratricopeptide (TPR) repeat protein
LILDAAFEPAARELERCEAAPREACEVLEAVRLFWRIQLDPHRRALDGAFEAAAERAIASTEAWAARAPDDAEAWFYVGAAYGARAQWRVLRRERLGAARDGGRIKRALERALQLDPALDDAHFGIGMYQYYAAVAPAAARMLRWILLLPGGNRTEGLARMLRARESGVLMRSEADYQLHVIYLWYEEGFVRALELLRDLERRHPRNPLFPQLVAEVLDVYFHDRGASRDAWAGLLERAGRGDVNEASLASGHARLGLAGQLDALHETDRAIPLWRAVVDAPRGGGPYASRAEALVRLGDAHARLGDRDRAAAHYREALAAVPPDDVREIRRRALSGIARRDPPARGEAYRLSLEGWRAFERGEHTRARSSLARAVTLAPDDRVIRYRYGHVLLREDAAAARVHLERAVAGPVDDAPTFVARASVDLARLHETRGEIADAIRWYERATSTFGAERETMAAAERALARLRRADGPR